MFNIVVIVPHPDDETALCGGLIARAVEKGVDVKVVLITSGAHGRTLGLVPENALAAARRKEAKLATGVLGVRNLKFLNYDDYDPRGNKTYDWPGAKRKLLAALGRVSSNTLIIGFPPNGMNGHPDHVRASQLASEIAKENGAALLYATTAAAEKSLGTTTYMKAGHRRKLHMPPTHILKLSGAEIEKKTWALSYYRTQALSMLDLLRHAEGNLSEEHFSLAQGGAEVKKFLAGFLKVSGPKNSRKRK